MKYFKPNVLSDVLFSEFVLKKEENERFKLDSRWNSSEYFYDCVASYKIALVLIALLNHLGLYSPQLAALRILRVSRILIPRCLRRGSSLNDQNNKMPWTMACLRAAGVLGNDQAILHSRSSVIGMGWAMAWLKEAGIIETNPATLFEFSLMWMDNYLAINNFLNECNPIV